MQQGQVSLDVTLGQSRTFLTTFFSDMRGFTAAAGQMEPEELERAVRMELEMLEHMRALEDHWYRRYDQVFEIGIGIATGWITVGDFGSPARTDYTVLGNQVSLASRLAGKARPGRSS